MKKLLLFTLLFYFSPTFSQVGCYDFNKRGKINLKDIFSPSRIGCYDFNHNRHNRICALKVGVGILPIMMRDMDGLPIRMYMIEMDYGDWGGGMQADARYGSTYITLNYLKYMPPVSIDTRFYGFVKPLKNKNISLGGYAQLNSTNMWVDGWALGGYTRYSKDWQWFGVFSQLTLPLVHRERKAVSLNSTAARTYMAGIPITQSNIKRTRPSEFRFTVGVYLRWVHMIYPIK